MLIEANTFDELYIKTCKELTENGKLTSPRGLETKELLGVLLKLHNPRTRLLNIKSRKYSTSYAIAEWLWIMKGSNRLDMIRHYAPSYHLYSDDGETLHGAYGPRIMVLINKVIELLKSDPESRRALVPIYTQKDVGVNSKDIPCTSTIQFIIRDNKLDAFVHMRSNDVYLGLPYDLFCFTMIQEYISIRLGVELGTYHHLVNSLHIYEKSYQKIHNISLEKIPNIKEMDVMPSEDLLNQLELLYNAEFNLRYRNDILKKGELNSYFNCLYEKLVNYSLNKRLKLSGR